jgi:hypothetical protein
MKAIPAMILLSATTLGCNERLVSSDQVPLDPMCMIPWGTRGHWLDGTSALVETAEGDTPYACACIIEEQFWEEVETGRWTEELGAELLVECERIAALQGFDWNDCQSDYESGKWSIAQMGLQDFILASVDCPGPSWTGTSEPYPDEPPIMCDLGDPGCSCTVEATCTGGATCVDGMCQTP